MWWDTTAAHAAAVSQSMAAQLCRRGEEGGDTGHLDCVLRWPNLYHKIYHISTATRITTATTNTTNTMTIPTITTITNYYDHYYYHHYDLLLLLLQLL